MPGTLRCCLQAVDRHSLCWWLVQAVCVSTRTSLGALSVRVGWVGGCLDPTLCAHIANSVFVRNVYLLHVDTCSAV